MPIDKCNITLSLSVCMWTGQDRAVTGQRGALFCGGVRIMRNRPLPWIPAPLPTTGPPDPRSLSFLFSLPPADTWDALTFFLHSLPFLSVFPSGTYFIHSVFFFSPGTRAADIYFPSYFALFWKSFDSTHFTLNEM